MVCHRADFLSHLLGADEGFSILLQVQNGLQGGCAKTLSQHKKEVRVLIDLSCLLKSPSASEWVCRVWGNFLLSGGSGQATQPWHCLHRLWPQLPLSHVWSWIISKEKPLQYGNILDFFFSLSLDCLSESGVDVLRRESCWVVFFPAPPQCSITAEEHTASLK